MGRRGDHRRGIVRYGGWPGGAGDEWGYAVWWIFRFGARPVFRFRFIDRAAGLVWVDRTILVRSSDCGRDDCVRDGELRSGARGKLDSDVQGRIHGAAGAGGAGDYRRAVRPHGTGVVG